MVQMFKPYLIEDHEIHKPERTWKMPSSPGLEVPLHGEGQTAGTMHHFDWFWKKMKKKKKKYSVQFTRLKWFG